MKQLIVISSPTPVPDEADRINQLFDEGLQLLHLRKPDYSTDELLRLVDAIHPQHHKRLVLPFSFLAELKTSKSTIKKLHFFEFLRQKTAPEIFHELNAQGYTLSTSIHEASTYPTLPEAFDYTFFGPVFDSISKQGYEAMNAGQLEVLKQKRTSKIIALGGIQESNCLQALSYGFDGVAVLGAVWQNEHPVAAFKKIQTCIMSAQ